MINSNFVHQRLYQQGERDFSNEKILQVLQALQKAVLIHNGFLVATYHCPRQIPKFVVFEKRGEVKSLRYRRLKGLCKRYHVEITETLQKVVDVMATTPDGAIEEVRKKYREGEIVLDSSDCIDFNVEILR